VIDGRKEGKGKQTKECTIRTHTFSFLSRETMRRAIKYNTEQSKVSQRRCEKSNKKKFNQKHEELQKNCNHPFRVMCLF